MKDYQGALQDLNKVNVFEPNIAFTLRMYMERSKRCWMVIKEPCKISTRMTFLNQTMHSFWKYMEMSKGCWWQIIKNLYKMLTRLTFQTKQYNHFGNIWRCQKDITWLSRSFVRLQQGLCFWMTQCIHFENVQKNQNNVGWS